MIPVLKVFPAKQWHDTVSIIGNRESLQNLLMVIQSSLNEGYSQSEFMESDGEGYKVEIKLLDEKFGSKSWDNLPMHYTDEMCKERDSGKWEDLHKILK